jgi:hypothetical protein
MYKNRPLTVLFSTLMLVSLGCNFFGQLFSKQGSPTLPEIAASNNPQTLADHITQAATADERYIALLEIMKSLNLGVYTGNGEAIVPGAERGPDDFYLYDFEVSALASALERKETWSVSDLAQELSDLGVQPGGKSLTIQDFQESLASSVNESIQDPGNPLSLVQLLIRELGLRQAPSYDIAAVTSPEQIKFDALQRFLIISDVLIPLVDAPGQSHIFEEPVSLVSNQDFHLPAIGDPCSFIGASDVGGFKFGKLLIALTTLQKKVGPWFIIAGIVLDAWHAELLGILVDVQETQASKSQGHETHYGPEGAHTAKTGIPGKSILFQIGVQMLTDLSEYPALKCGKLVGLTFPPKGPVKDVVISWSNTLSSTTLLEKQGTILREDKITDSNGLASLVFQPNDEPEATQSIRSSTAQIKQFAGVMGPTANVATSFGNVVAHAANIIISRSRKGLNMVKLGSVKGDQEPCPSPPSRLPEQFVPSKC